MNDNKPVTEVCFQCLYVYVVCVSVIHSAVSEPL